MTTSLRQGVLCLLCIRVPHRGPVASATPMPHIGRQEELPGVQAGPVVSHPCICSHRSPQVERAVSATVHAVSTRLPGSRHRYPWAGANGLATFACLGDGKYN